MENHMDRQNGTQNDSQNGNRDPKQLKKAVKRPVETKSPDNIEDEKRELEKSNFLVHLIDKVKKGEINPLKTNFEQIQQQYSEFEQNKRKTLEKYIAYEAVIAGATDSVEYYVLLVLSCFIALFGLFQNSAAVIIGAMIVAPLMGPVLGFSAGVMWGSTRAIVGALLTLVKGIIIVLAITSLFTLLVPSVSITAEMDARSHPGLFDIAVALSCGFVGAYAFANRKISSALPGVAISVALMPPLCTVGIGIGLMDMRLLTGALLLFAINLIGISFAGAIVFYLVKLAPHSESDKKDEITKRAAIQLVVSILLIAAICVPISVFTINGYRMNAQKKQIETEISALIDPASVFHSQIRTGDNTKVLLVLYESDENTVSGLESALRRKLGTDAEIRIYTLQRAAVLK